MFTYAAIFIGSLPFKCIKTHLWLTIWSLLENVPWSLEKIVYYIVVGYSVVEVSVRTDWLIVLFNFSESLLILSCCPVHY